MAKQYWIVAALAVLLPFSMAQDAGTHCLQSPEPSITSALEACMTPYLPIHDSCALSLQATAVGTAHPDDIKCICSFYSAAVQNCYSIICDPTGVSIWGDQYRSCLGETGFPGAPTTTAAIGATTTALTTPPTTGAPTGTGSGTAASKPTTTSSGGAGLGSREAKGGAIAGLLLIGVVGWWL